MRWLLPVFLFACSGTTQTIPDAGGSDAASVDCPKEDNVVQVSGGCIRGTSGSVRSFLGVPYAAPPVADLRFKPPADVKPWMGVRDANATSKACPQIATLVNGKTLEWDEDCLYLNVWTSTLDPNAKVPVMVWIHGGGLVTGSGGEGIYSGKYMAEKGGVVAISINYRLAQLGYAGHPALSKEQGRSGNYGLQDQIAALKWVQANAAKFGGDPNRVTIYGESAGGLSVCSLMASPRGAGLFHRAVIESGGCPTYSTYVRPQKSAMGFEGTEEQGVRLAMALGCGNDDNTLACMRGKPAKDVLNALPAVVGVLSQGERYGFTVDGDVLPDTPDARTASGNYNKVPVAIGTNADEGTLFVASLLVPTDQAYSAYVHGYFPGAKGDAVMAQYPSASYASPKAALAAVVTDSVFACPSRKKARDFAKALPDVWLYQFTQVPSYATNTPFGSFHGGEVDFVLGTLRDRTTGMPTMEELALSDAMMGQWTNLAKNGNPGAMWPKYDAASDTNITFANPITTAMGLKKQKCDFWDTL